MTFDQWLTTKGIAPERSAEFADLIASIPFLERPERIMNPDIWFYFPDNQRFIVLGTAPNGDGIALDTMRASYSVVYIDHARLHDHISDEDRAVKVAASLDEFVDEQLNPGFPLDYWEAKEKQKC